jgi:hypothetical protein
MTSDLNKLNELASQLSSSNESEHLYMGLITLENPDYEGALCQTQSIVRATSRDHAISQLNVLVTCGEYLPEEWTHCSLLRIDVSIIERDSGDYQVLKNWFGDQWQSDIDPEFL